MKQFSQFSEEKNTFILKFEEIKEQVIIVLDKLLKLTTSQITTSHLSSMQTAIQKDCESILQELRISISLIEENSNALTSQNADISLLKADLNSLLGIIPNDLIDVLNNLETMLTDLPNRTLGQVDLQELESRLNISLTNLHNNILSESLGVDEPLNMEDRLKSLLVKIHSLCESISTSVAQTLGLSSQFEELSSNVQNLQSLVNSMQSNLDVALMYIKNNGSLIEPGPPFNPAPETIFRTRSVSYPWRRYLGQLSSIEFSPEYFILNDNASAVLKIEYDFKADEIIENVVSDVYLNDELVDRITFNAEVGTKRIVHTAIFQLDRTNGHFQVKINSVSSANRHIYDVYLCTNEYYFFRWTEKTLDYLITTMTDTNFTQDFQTYVAMNERYYYQPAITITYKGNNQPAVLLYKTYMRLDLVNFTAEVYDADTNTKKTSVNTQLNGKRSDIVEMGSIYASSYQLSVMMFQHYSKTYKFGKFYSTLTSSSVGSLVQTSRNYVDFEYLVNCLTPVSKIFHQKVLILCQDDTGCWFLEDRENIEKAMNLALGFGTKVKFSYCPTFIGGTTTRNECFRVFMYVYDHWVAKYFELLSDLTTANLLKAKVIEGDFDQILPGTGNEYFTIKDGAITKHFDEDVKSLDEYLL